MKTIAKKLSALLLCLLCLFSMLACGETAPENKTPKIGDPVKIEHLSIDTVIYDILGSATIRFIPKYEISELIIIIKAYDKEDFLLEQVTADLGNLVGEQEFVYHYNMQDTAFNYKKQIDRVDISIKSGTISGI